MNLDKTNKPGRCIVILPLLGADSILLHREQKLAEAFSKMGHEVYFVNRKTNPFTGRSHGNHSLKNLKIINVYGLPYLKGRFPFVYKINDLILSKQLLAALKKINMAKIFYVTNPDWGFITSKVKTHDDSVIYDMSDDYVELAKNNSWKIIVKKYEEKTIEVANKFIVTNDFLGKKVPKEKNCILVSNGVDFTGFDEAKPCLKRGKYHALAGFIGGIYNWVDLDLLKRLATSFPDVGFLLIGPTNRKNELERLKRIDNIEIIGSVSKEKIADYFASLDVGLVPFVSEKEYPRLASVDSNKIYQYMYFGYPIIATSFPQTRTLSNLLLVAESKEEFIDCLRKVLAIKDQRSKERVNYALANTWEVKARKIIDFLEK